ncbi:hypothetical protein [Candidatus Formimonas warabiya]|uniref:Uncharacterized protein n=1 Tax=Formimonas warabiya TaxID=1761012 RepID=A0A3G1KPR1_FORW1|nr:hypothetical protein [Candidatus Formimonas warabiya]ATW24420.1 hypothetical protein DCMF_06140 [Candidatus Formimonas warabiya]
MSLFNDRLTRGFVAGLIGCIPLFIFNNAAYYLKISQLRYLDFAAVIIYGHRVTNTMEVLFAFFATLFFASALGVVFACLIPAVTHRNILFKGFLFSGGVWFFCYALTVLFKIPEVSHVNVFTAFCNFIGAVIWGLSLAYALQWIDRKGKQISS